ncbi:aminodeoxychorismate lyase [Vibrio proteolyticus]|uniref:Aminodeoxychorismate lyase n=1 Tax=Vibrio proteolyticus NBRC 13287 TaxID=1219065 RepID=U3BI11_VIBPR|nr:aminodeoxychorismate lyase [Vibrio proteolyticus]GAD66298.1 aminodeoxychorismate lyase [Vibrio proteolyticus NBRC 13287]
MFWVNGRPSNVITITDRSFQYGDGCFTTMLTVGGEIQHWSLHIERMEACLNLLDIPLPDWEQVHLWLQEAALNDERAGLKLHVTRGSGGRGYSPAGMTSPNVTISHFSYPLHYAAFTDTGVQLGVCDRRLGVNPMLAGHKHNNRLEQILLKAEMDQAGYQDGVALDINGHVVETTMANLFWVKGNTLYTPSLDFAGVSGVVRRLVIEKTPSLQLNVVMGEFDLEHLEQAQEVFMTNSILGVAPVTQIGHHYYSIGAITRRFQESLNSC